ncbi:hypothetical protein HON15_01265 [Candidatus Woesearchaeota archaeon]|nr:hypothetical protein [Candidatus Woesearchaeota archaeon]
MVQKRGLLVVVVMVLFVVLLSFAGIGVDEDTRDSLVLNYFIPGSVLKDDFYWTHANFPNDDDDRYVFNVEDDDPFILEWESFYKLKNDEFQSEVNSKYGNEIQFYKILNNYDNFISGNQRKYFFNDFYPPFSSRYHTGSGIEDLFNGDTLQAFIIWTYVLPDEGEDIYIKNFNVLDSDDDLSFIHATCNNDLSSCKEVSIGRKKNYDSNSGKTENPFYFSQGWNVIVMVLDNDIGNDQSLEVYPKLIFISENNNDNGEGYDSHFIYADSSIDNADKDNDGVWKWHDMCSNSIDDNVIGYDTLLGCAGDEICETNVKKVLGCGIDSDYADQNEDVCNIGLDDGTSFDYDENIIGNGCCGNNGFEDFETYSEDRQFVCLRKDKVEDEEWFVGYNKESEGNNNPFFGCETDRCWIDAQTGCETDWCWIDAQTISHSIMTIHKEQFPYDIVSNGKKWKKCSTPGPLEKAEGNPEYFQKSNRFYCYQEGKHWSWTECVPSDAASESSTVPGVNKDTIKGRMYGEALYSFPNPSLIDKYWIIDSSNEQNEQYTQYYGEDYTFDFTGYTNLEFMVRFIDEELTLPADVTVEFLAKDTTLSNSEYLPLLKRNVLWSSSNSPLLESEINEENLQRKWIHVSIPINDLTRVDKIVISPSSNNDIIKNTIEIQNVYLTNSEPTLFCSGKSNDNPSVWIPSDDSEADYICNAFYDSGIDDITDFQSVVGGNAWSEDHGCCGDGKNDNFVGEEGEYGCWNSEIVAPSGRIMDVEFDGTSMVPSFIKTDSYTSDIIIKLKRRYSLTFSNINQIFGIKTVYHEPTRTYKITQEFSSPDIYTISIKDQIQQFLDETTLTFPTDFSCKNTHDLEDKFPEITQRCILCEQHLGNDYCDSGYLLYGDFFDNGIYIALKQNNDLDVNRLFDISNDIDLGLYKEISSQDLSNYASSFKIQAQKLNPFSFIPGNSLETPFNIKYSCKSDTCTYPLPGTFPYTITNKHPYLYDLYFVSSDDEGEPIEVLITNEEGQTFDNPGNIIAKKVPQQILYGTDERGKNKFFGCLTPDLEGSTSLGTDFDNVEHCAVKKSGEESFICSPSVYNKEEGKEGFVTVNEWTSEGITYGGYADVDNPNTVEDVVLSLKPLKETEGEEIPPEDFETVTLDENGEELSRDTTPPTKSIPARNIIPNADFNAENSDTIHHWDMFDSRMVLRDNVFLDDIGLNLEDMGKVFLTSTETLRSEKIPVSGDKLYFTYDGLNVKATYTLVMNDGTSEEGPQEASSGAEINTEDTAYIILEFTSSSDDTVGIAGRGDIAVPQGDFVEKPMLQIVDGEPLDYYDVDVSNKEELLPNDFRSGIACCPTNFCWNGYACVEPMNDDPYMVEVLDDRTYRCIDGSWNEADVKTDWYESDWGFCPQDDGCFVYTGDNYGESTEEFYTEGNLPQCIGNTEYVFDHYCEDGSWTTRTKRIASEFLDFVDAKDEYTIACGPYDETLTNSPIQYFRGDGVTETIPSDEGVELLESSPVTDPTCFSKVDSTLLDTKENTCVNNVCVVRYKDGGENKVVFATSLNSFKTDKDETKVATASFLSTLGIEPEQLDECADGEEFSRCDLGVDADIWYSKDLDALVYGKEQFNLVPSTWDNVKNFFTDFFTNNEFESLDGFIDEAKNFNHLYVLKNDAFEVKAIREIRNLEKQEGSPTDNQRKKQRLVAEFDGFTSPLCDYVEEDTPVRWNIPLEAVSPPILPEKWACEKDSTGTQRFEAIVEQSGTGVLDFFWPQLTSKLRIEEQDET